MYDMLYEPKKSAILESEKHGWNSVLINDQAKYIAPTWISGQQIDINGVEISALEAVKKGYINKLDWYMEDPYTVFLKEQSNESTSHTPVYIPPQFKKEIKITPN